jgi:hypothetical protein
MEVTFNALSVSTASNVTDRYNVDDDGNCTNLLGDECTQTIIRRIGEGSTIQIVFPECRDTIGGNGFTQEGGAGTSKPSILCIN